MGNAEPETLLCIIAETDGSTVGVGIDFSNGKIWIEENGLKKIEIAWSELNAAEEAEVLKAIDDHWDELNKLIDDVFAGKKIQIKRIK